MPPTPKDPAELTILSFKTQRAWAAWLKKNHARSTGVWLKLAKKGAGPSLTYAQAVEEALCYGWIDGQAKPLDDTAWLQRYTPRRPRSPWSKINRAKAGAAGGRTPAGGRAGRHRSRQSGWTLGRGLRLAGRRQRARRPAGRARPAPAGQSLLRQPQQRQPLRHHLPAAECQKARDPRPPPGAVRRHSGARREAASLNGKEDSTTTPASCAGAGGTKTQRAEWWLLVNQWQMFDQPPTLKP